jgi:hypothetical protein
MTLLDQLAKQAELRKAPESGGETAVEREANFKILEERLPKFRDYLQQLTALLAAHPERLEQRYEIPGYGTIVALIAHDYEVKIFSPSKNSLEVKLNFNANVQSDACPLVAVAGVSRIQTIKAIFDKHRIPALQDTKKDAAGATAQANFRARGKIPLGLHAIAESSTGHVKLTISNFEDLGSSTKTYSIDQFDENLYDVIGHYIARKDNELTKEKLPDGVLKKLRHTAQQNEMRRKWEEKLAEQAAAAEMARQQEQEQSKLHNRMMAQGKMLFGKLSDLIKKKE